MRPVTLIPTELTWQNGGEFGGCVSGDGRSHAINRHELGTDRVARRSPSRLVAPSAIRQVITDNNVSTQIVEALQSQKIEVTSSSLFVSNLISNSSIGSDVLDDPADCAGGTRSVGLKAGVQRPE
jgi:hypothetical protein